MFERYRYLVCNTEISQTIAGQMTMSALNANQKFLLNVKLRYTYAFLLHNNIVTKRERDIHKQSKVLVPINYHQPIYQ